MQGLVMIMEIPRSEAPQNAMLLSAGSNSNTVSNSFGETGSTMAVGTGKGIDGASALRSTTMRLRHSERTIMNSSIETHFNCRACAPTDSGTTSSGIVG